MARSWKPDIEVTLHGRWDPQDEVACSGVIAEVNRLRRPDNPRPKIRRDDWGTIWLDAQIGDTSMRIDPGENLMSLRPPRGDVIYSVIDDDELEMLAPPC